MLSCSSSTFFLSLQYWEGILCFVQHSELRVETCAWMLHFPRRQFLLD
jgi:hypothetical protein